jgi:hypothetical protein
MQLLLSKAAKRGSTAGLDSVTFFVQHGRRIGSLQRFLSERRVLGRDVAAIRMAFMVSYVVSHSDYQQYLRGVLVQKLSRASLIQSVLLRNDTLAQSIGDVVGAEEPNDDHGDLCGYEGKGGGVPSLHRSSFKLEVLGFATGKDRSRVAGVGRHRFDERRVVATAVELHRQDVYQRVALGYISEGRASVAYRILDPDSPVQAEVSTPLSVDLPFQIEGLFLVGDVSGCDDQREAEPEEERVERQEGPVVE